MDRELVAVLGTVAIIFVTIFGVMAYLEYQNDVMIVDLIKNGIPPCEARMAIEN